MELQSVCPECGTPFIRTDPRAQCKTCLPMNRRQSRASSRIRDRDPQRGRDGYDWRWRKLSKRARALQPFCSDCGSPYDLTADHSPRAWQRWEAGLTIRLEDIDVVCRRCNTDRGPARGPGAVERERPTVPADPTDPADDEHLAGGGGPHRPAPPPGWQGKISD